MAHIISENESYVGSYDENKLPGPADTKTKLSLKEKAQKGMLSVRDQFFTKKGLLGGPEVDYKFLFKPTLPFISQNAAPVFFPLDAKMPICLAAILGLQHALAMMGGLVSAALLFGQMANLDTSDRTYLVSASLIGSGILSIFQVHRLKIWKTKYFVGTGMVSVLGMCFATVPVYSTALQSMYASGFCPTAEDGTRLACRHAYGAFLGTSMVCALLEILFSFLPQRVLLGIFPPIVNGPVVLMIGIDLIESGMTDWAGGASCHNGGLCKFSDDAHAHEWGAGQWIGLGFSVFVTILLCDKWGPPIFKSCAIIVGLLVGCIIGGATGYFTGENISQAAAGQFVWVHTFPLSVYGPIVLPLIAVYMVVIMESVGDISATAEVSRQPCEGPEFESRIQGGVLMSGLGSVIGGLMTLQPVASFAQNNGVIAMTQCAARYSGYFACLFLILMGVIGKFSAVIVAIPKPIIGGMTTFLFTSVAVSGIRIICNIKFTRRDRMVLTIALMWGFASMLVPEWFAKVITYKGDNTGKKGFVQAIQNVVETPPAITGFAAVIANLIFPQIEDDTGSAEEEPFIETIDAQEVDNRDDGPVFTKS